MTSKTLLHKHQNFQGFESPHLKMNRGLEKRIDGKPIRKFAIVLIVEILPVRSLPYKTWGGDDYIAATS